MKKLYTFACLLLVATLSQAQTYSYDFNPNTKIARLYTNNEIILEYNVLMEHASLDNYEFTNGYILEKSDNEWKETGFYNSREIIYNKVPYLLKTNLISRVLVKKEGNKKWIKVNFKKNKISFENTFDELPEAVRYVVLTENLKNICIRELEYIRKKRENEYLDKIKEHQS